MTVTNIKKLDYSKYELTVVPNLIERLFGYKESTFVLKDTGKTYLLGSGGIYIDSEGNATGNGSLYGIAIDKFKLKQDFNQ